jgi:hypothetical protein
LVVATLLQPLHLELTPGQEDLVLEMKVSQRPRHGAWVKPAACMPPAAARAQIDRVARAG